MSRAVHPARSLDFLSRLHDGELTAAERAHFESHRAHCDECRRAATEFEATLDYYRASGTPAAKPDLAARILRRLETTSPRRRPFGVVFGIDLKWAGAFMAALVVTILGYSLLDRRREREQIRVSFSAPSAAQTKLVSAEPEPAVVPPEVRADREKKAPDSRISALLLKKEAPPAAPVAGAAPGVKANANVDAVSAPPSSVEEAKVAATAPAEKALPVPRTSAPARPMAAEAQDAARPVAAADGSDRRVRAEMVVQPASSAASVAPPPTPAPIRLTVRALDELGAPPPIVNGAEVEFRQEDRGRYVFTVGTDGVPLDIHREEASRESPSAASKTPAAESLKKLRFAAADRPRRLLVAVE